MLYDFSRDFKILTQKPRISKSLAGALFGYY